jgi:phospholipase C
MISISLSDESWAWGIDSSHEVWQYAGSADGWVPRPTFNPNGTTTPQLIATGDDTTTWGLDNTGIPYSYDVSQNAWTEISHSGTTNALSVLAVADALNIWALNTPGNIYTYGEATMKFTLELSSTSFTQAAAQDSQNTWLLVGGKGVSSGNVSDWAPTSLGGGLLQIAGSSDGTLWGVGADNNPWLYTTGTTWQKIVVPQATAQISQMAVGSTLLVYSVDQGGNVYPYQDSAWQSPLSGTGIIEGNTLTSLSAAADGSLFALDNANNLYIYLLGSWLKIGGQYKQVAAGSASNVWAIDATGNPVSLTPGMGGEAPGAALSHLGHLHSAWDAESVTDETLSTHLWIVDKAFALSRQEATVGQLLLGIFRNSTFHTNMCQGLYDADFKAPYNNPWLGQPTYVSHFFDPATGLNYLGFPSPTALTQGREYFSSSLSYYQANDMANAGYYLGLSLHYLTDLTQPMHSSSFTALSSHPVLGTMGYHPVFESYVMEHQGSVPPLRSYTPSNLGLSPDPYLIQAAEASQNYYDAICPWEVFYLWSGQLTNSLKGAIDGQIAPILWGAINITSQYIVAWGYNVQNASR